MTAASTSRDADFSAGRVLGDSFRVLGSNLPAFLFLSLLLLSPVYLFLALVVLDADLVLSVPDVVFEYGVTFAEMLLGFVAQAAVVYGTVRHLQGRRAGFAENVIGGLRKVVPVAFVAIAAGFATMLGMMFFLVPGLMIMTAYWVAVPAAVVEDRGIGASLTRSGDLTRDYRWRVFGVILVSLAFEVVSENLVGSVFGFEDNYYLSLAAAWLLAGASTALGAVLSAVTYHELRRVKEGVDVDQIAAVFD